MVQDNGEDESVGKPADAICNWKEVVEEDVSKGPDKVNLEHEYSAKMHHQSDQRRGMDNERCLIHNKQKLKGMWRKMGHLCLKMVLFFDFAKGIYVKNFVALYDDRCTITTIKEIHRSVNDEQVKVVKDLWFWELVKFKPFEILKDIVSWAINNFDCERHCLHVHGKMMFVDEKEMESVLGIKSGTIDIIEALVKGNCDSALERELDFEIKKRNRENKASVIGYMYMLAILYMECFYPVGKRLLPETSRNLTRVLNWDKNRVLSRVKTLQGIGLFRGEDVPIVDIKELDVDDHLEGVHKRLDLLDQNMKELQGALEEVICICKSVETANRSVMEVAMNMMTMLKKDQEDELRDNRDDTREEEGRRQENSYMHYDELGGDVNDEIGVAGDKMPGYKIENELEKENPIEKYIGSDNQCNNMKIDKDCFSDGNHKLSRGEIGGEDDDPLNSVNLKSFLHDIQMAFEKQSSESSGEFNRARVAGVHTTHENDRKQGGLLK
ncbi:hypothetical protein M9H77_03489 [Catharanthus roseus]|uniref:Uncharacterized protein n=1 Tax=Catharanthus roseus TaxID=4058 RepID=A0ACC0CBG1_CATRO|nr:hypothetical protein M9H77_03489 [Catharanthus roseus]